MLVRASVATKSRMYEKRKNRMQAERSLLRFPYFKAWLNPRASRTGFVLTT